MLCSKGKILPLLFLLSALMCRAQDYPLYSQYMYNGLAINPAAAGSRDVLNLAVMYRGQFRGGGTPVTQTLTGDIPIQNPRIALGLLVINDKHGIQRKTGAYAVYAYRTNLAKGKFSLGLQAGFDEMHEAGDDILLIDKGDPMFDGMNHKTFMPNVGMGAYYYSSKAFAGISAPHLLLYKPKSADEYHKSLSFADIIIYGGAIIPLMEHLKLKPSALMRTGNGFMFDVNCNALFLPDDRLEIGVSYRNVGAIIAMAEVRVNPQLCIGYSYDHSLGKANITNGSHEIMVRYEFRYRLKSVSPLYLK